MTQISRQNGSISSKCGKKYARKSSAEEMLTTKSGSLLIPWGNWMWAALKASRTRAAKANVQEDYTAKDKEVNKSIRKDKRDHIDNLVKQAKEAAGQGNLRELYMVTMKLSNKFQQTYKPVKDKNRNLLQ